LIYEFGEFQLDALRRVLSSHVDGQALQVTGKVFDTLLYFVEHAGQLLDKRELMAALWPNVQVEESNLTQTIHTLRRALGERPDEHRFIVTVPGRGYRFVADVRERAPAAPELAVIETGGEADRVPRHGRKKLIYVALSLAVLGVSLLFFFRWPGETSRSPADLPTRSIAVLPFVDMSPEQNQEYFSDGLSEQILNLLAHSTELRVIARTSSFSFKDKSVDIATIADKLNVTHVLEGSVRKSGDRMRITAQLVDAATSAHLWSETYDRDVKDVFGVQTEIAASVAESLRVTLAGDDHPRRGETNSTQAFERYLQGRYFFNRRGASDVARAKNYFEQALHIDPGYARAWAGLAGVYYVERDVDGTSPEEALVRWREAVERALALGPNLAESHARAAQYYRETGEARVADEHFKQAMALRPSDPLVLGASASAAILEGRMDEAITLLRRAVAVDPLSALSRSNLGIHLMAIGQWEEAKSELRTALELSPTRLDLNADIAKILILQRRFDEALSVARQLPEGRLRDQCVALVYHATGNAAEADAALARLISLSEAPDPEAVVKLSIAEVYAFRGDDDEAFEWLALAIRQTREDRAVTSGWWTTLEIHISPLLKRLHTDPRWQSLLASAQ
jgi:TolB-like protein/DNA-binding winged helix-turn-helix (wHTH) protein/Flp pilus assembly protein TadD